MDICQPNTSEELALDFDVDHDWLLETIDYYLDKLLMPYGSVCAGTSYTTKGDFVFIYNLTARTYSLISQKLLHMGYYTRRNLCPVDLSP